MGHSEKSDATHGEEWAEDVRFPPSEATQVANTAMCGSTQITNVRNYEIFPL